jgi:hypothetical protein
VAPFYLLATDKERRNFVAPTRYNYADLIYYAEEMCSLDKNKTWKLLELPKKQWVVRCKWVFKKKKGTTRT